MNQEEAGLRAQGSPGGTHGPVLGRLAGLLVLPPEPRGPTGRPLRARYPSRGGPRTCPAPWFPQPVRTPRSVHLVPTPTCPSHLHLSVPPPSVQHSHQLVEGSGCRAETCRRCPQMVKFSAQENKHREPYHYIGKELLQSCNVGSNSNVNFRDKILHKSG